jgi:hypothetical protein
MTIKELFEGPVGDYCIARNTIKCLFLEYCKGHFLDIMHETLSSGHLEKNVQIIAHVSQLASPSKTFKILH